MNTVARITLISSVIPTFLLALAGAPAHAEDRPTIRATTRLVELNVVVVDKEGKPVSGLSQNDFQVFDNGGEQKVVHFSGNTVSSAPQERSPLVITNRQQTGERLPGVTVILVDELILQARSYTMLRKEGGEEDAKQPIRSARLAVLKFLATLQPGAQVALYALRQEGVVVIHDFTDDSTVLMAAAKALGTTYSRASIPISSMAETTAARTLRDWLYNPSSGRESENHQSTQGIDVRLLSGGFQAIAQHLQGVPGRKNLVWISSTLPLNIYGFDLQAMLSERDATNSQVPSLANPTPTPQFANPDIRYAQLRSFARQLSNADISVYPIDANTLSEGGHSEAQWAAADLIASETGGRAVFDSNGLDQHLREIVAETSATYQLGYYPGNARWDGKYHRVEVRLRRKGLKVLCRKGYVAADQPASQSPDAALRSAAKSAVDDASIGVALNVSSNPLEWGPEKVVVKLDIRDIHFDQSDGRWRASVDVGFAELSKDGRILGGPEDHLDLALLPETYSNAEARGWFYPKDLFLSPEVEKLRVIVRDLATARIGSVSVRVVHDRPELSRRGDFSGRFEGSTSPTLRLPGEKGF